MLCKAIKLSFLLAVLAVALLAFGQHPNPNADLPRIQTDELAKAIQSASGQKPVILYVGPAILYNQGHVRGAELIGPVARPEGVEKLKARAASLSHDRQVVIYCGCCPWDHCPNIKPAYQELQKMGFTKVRVLYLPTSFGTDWTDKGYPTDKG